MIEPDWDLPEGYTSTLKHDGSVLLHRKGALVGEFPMLTPRTVLGGWAEAYEAGFTAGEKSGTAQLVAKLRDWLTAEVA
jgi:hypothetical protein